MYESFAQVYDKFMDNVPYDSWAWQLCRILSRYGIDDGLVLDLGCGTGQMTRRLRDRGYDMIGCRTCGPLSCMGRSGRSARAVIV